MRDEYHVIEQLDLAGRQLKNVDANYARFAIILTDNIVELMLYRRCKQAIREDGALFSYGRRYQVHEPKYSDALRKDAEGRNFEKKVEFCRHQLQLLTEDEHVFINSVHSYRNEAYHVGIKHEDLLYPIAWQYHDFACNLFRKLSLSAHRVTCSSDIVSKVVQHHSHEEGIRLENSEEDLANATNSLKQLKPQLTPGFAAQLSGCLINRIDDFAQSLWSLTGQGERDETEMFHEVQFHFYLFDESPVKTQLTQKMLPWDYEKLWKEQRSNWRPKYRNLPTERWRQRSEQLSHVKCPMLAMKKFQTLLCEIEPLRLNMCQAAEDYENQQQLEWDLRNGR